VIRIVLAGSTEQTRARVAALLADRLGLPAGDSAELADGFVLADPPADPVSFDAALARRGTEVDALVHLGGAPESLLDHYGRAVIESRSAEVDDILGLVREAMVAG
jgi:hypothetical protein